jgi:hypothetical protein
MGEDDTPTPGNAFIVSNADQARDAHAEMLRLAQERETTFIRGLFSSGGYLPQNGK